jgi:Skp family chaperone for outer membrane proteins
MSETKNTISTWLIAAMILISLCLSIASASGAVYWYDRHKAVKIAAIDLQGYLAAQKERYVKGEITQDEFKRRIDNLEALLKQVPDNTVVLTADVVVRNAVKIEPQ